MSIAHDILVDISGTVDMTGGCLRSDSIEFNTAGFSMGAVIPVGVAAAGGGAWLEGTCNEGGLWLLVAAPLCVSLDELAEGSTSASMTGNFWPRSLPLLATPTPHVKVVLYPEHSRPISRHWEQ